MKKIIILSLLFLGMLPAISGCETSRGLGEDMENAGHEIKGAAHDVADDVDDAL